MCRRWLSFVLEAKTIPVSSICSRTQQEMHRISHKMFASVPTQNKYLLFGARMGYKRPENKSIWNSFPNITTKANYCYMPYCHVDDDLWFTMLSVRCEILVTTESKLAAVSPRPGAGDDRGTVQGYSQKSESRAEPDNSKPASLGWHGDHGSPLSALPLLTLLCAPFLS